MTFSIFEVLYNARFMIHYELCSQFFVLLLKGIHRELKKNILSVAAFYPETKLQSKINFVTAET